jgi:hypothetical protein
VLRSLSSPLPGSRQRPPASPMPLPPRPPHPASLNNLADTAPHNIHGDGKAHLVINNDFLGGGGDWGKEDHRIVMSLLDCHSVRQTCCTCERRQEPPAPHFRQSMDARPRVLPHAPHPRTPLLAPLGEYMAVLIPMRQPALSSRGPPLLPVGGGRQGGRAAGRGFDAGCDAQEKQPAVVKQMSAENEGSSAPGAGHDQLVARG